MLQSVQARFWAKVDLRELEPGSCWEWTGGNSGNGYGRFWLEGRSQQAHRVAYELTVAPIPAGLQLDHLCRNRLCVNPGHLEAVTLAENTRRRPRPTKCPQGHPYTPESTYLCPRGWRQCRICRRARDIQQRILDGRLRLY